MSASGAQKLRELLDRGYDEVMTSLKQMEELSVLAGEGLASKGTETFDERGTKDQMYDAWTSIIREINEKTNNSPVQIMKKTELFNKVYQAALGEYRDQLQAATREDAAQSTMKEEGLLGSIFGTLYPDVTAPRSRSSYWGADTALQLHYPKLRGDENKIANSRGSQLSVADYEMDFIKQVMTMPTARGFT